MDVSIIVPVYNAEHYVKQCLESLLVQQTTLSYEIICIDDGSTDGSLRILENYQDFIQIHTQSNRGPGAARNLGIQYAVGTFLLFVDSDDYVSIDFIEKMVQPLMIQNADISICDFYRVRGESSLYVDKGADEVYTSGNMRRPLLMEFHSCNKAFRKSLIVDLPYPENMFFEDVVMVSMAILKANMVIKIHKGLYYYRVVEGSTTNTLNERNYDIVKAHEMIEPYFIEAGYSDVIEFLFVNGILVDLCIKLVKAKGKQAKSEIYQYLNMVNKKYPKWENNKYVRESRFMKRLYLFLLRKHFYGIINMVYGMR